MSPPTPGPPTPVPPATAPPASDWLWHELGLSVEVADGADGAELRALVGLALRRNPRRAHLLVSRVLGKHLPVDPATALEAGARLGALVLALPGLGRSGPTPPGPTPPGPTPPGPTPSDLAPTDLAPTGVAPSGDVPAGDAPPDPAEPNGPVVIGYCETATALGHATADALPGSHYLHTTRRARPGVVPVLAFEESHSHAVHHWLVPEDPAVLRAPVPVVLVDDELSTGRTALGTIRALHAFAPRSRYVVATLVDARPPAARAAFAELAAELGVALDVVALISATVTVPADVAARAARIRSRFTPAPAAGGPAPPDRPAPVRYLAADWPADLPDGGRHRWSPADRRRLDAVVARAAETVRAALTRPDGRTLVLGTEELMYTPMRIAERLARATTGQVRYQSTTRSPVYPVDAEGYAIRAALTFPAPDDGSRVSHVYNVRPGLYDDIVVVLDTGVDAASPVPVADPGGLVEELRRCAPVTVLTVPSYQPAAGPCGDRRSVGR